MKNQSEKRLHMRKKAEKAKKGKNSKLLKLPEASDQQLNFGNKAYLLILPHAIWFGPHF